MQRWPVIAVGAAWLGAPPAAAQPYSDLAGALGLPAVASPIGGAHLAAAVSVADLDGDGRLDLVRSGGTGGPRLYRGNPDRTFVAMPNAFPGLLNDIDTAGHTLFDMDGDGDLDALFLRNGANRLFENLGDATFVDVTADRLPQAIGWGMSAAAGDLDGDGDLDLVVARYIDRVDFPLHRCLDNLLLENVGGRFVDRSVDAGFSAVRGCSFVAALADLDDDLDLDVIVVNDFARFVGGQELWRNDGDLRFSEVARDVGFVAPVYGMGVALGDPDQDGRWDAVVTNIGEVVALERQADGGFTDALDARAIGLRFAALQHQVTWTARWEDLDADGWLDLVLASGYLPAATFIASSHGMRSVVLRGGPDGRLTPIDGAVTFADAEHSARDVHAVDLDGDGRLELVMAHVNGRVSVYRSDADPPPRIPTTFELVATTTGAGAAGAVVTASACGTPRRVAVVGGASYGVADRGIVRLAWPDCPDLTAVSGTVRWPSGFEQTFSGRTASRVRVEEPAWLAIAGGLATIDLSQHARAVARVELGGAGLVIGEVTPVAARVWQAEVALADAGVAGRLDVAVDGRTWGAHPRVAPASALPLWLDPPWPVVDDALRVVTAPGATVTWLGETFEADAGGRVTVATPATPGDEELVATLGDSSARALVAVTAPIDPARSERTARDVHVALADVPTKSLRVRLRLVDRMNRLAPVVAADLGLLVDGVPRTPATVTESAGIWSLSLPHAELVDGARVQATVFGAPWFDPVVTAHVADLAELGARVDPARSGCWLSEPRLWADVGDRGTVVAMFADAQGMRLPELGVAPLFVGTGVVAVPGSGQPIGALGASAVVVAGAGPGTVRVSVPGQSAPVACDVAVGPRPALGPVASATLTYVGNTPPLRDGVSAWTIVPLEASGRAVGAGAGLELEAYDGDVVAGPSYDGMGRYVATIVPRSAPELTVRALVDGREVGIATIPVVDPDDPVEPAPEPGPEPVPDDAGEAPEDLDATGPDGDDAGDAEPPIEPAPEPAPEPTSDASDASDASAGGADADAVDADAAAADADAGPDATAEGGADEGPDWPADSGAEVAEARARGDDDGCAGGPGAWPLGLLALGARRRRVGADRVAG